MAATANRGLSFPCRLLPVRARRTPPYRCDLLDRGFAQLYSLSAFFARGFSLQSEEFERFIFFVECLLSLGRVAFDFFFFFLLRTFCFLNRTQFANISLRLFYFLNGIYYCKQWCLLLRTFYFLNMSILLQTCLLLWTFHFMNGIYRFKDVYILRTIDFFEYLLLECTVANVLYYKCCFVLFEMERLPLESVAANFYSLDEILAIWT